MLPWLCGTQRQDRLSHLRTEHLPSPVVTAKLLGSLPCQCHSQTRAMGSAFSPWLLVCTSRDFSGCFFLYRYWEGLVLFCLQVWMREIQCSVTEARYSLTTPNACRESACCDHGMVGKSYVLGRARTVSEGNNPTIWNYLYESPSFLNP